MQSYTFDFIPPSTNAMYRCYRNRICKSARLKMFEQQILTCFDDLEQDIKMIHGKLDVVVTFCLKGNKDIDLDNLLKALLDSLQGILYKNDKLIIHIDAKKVNGCKQNQTKITLLPIAEIEEKTI